MLKFLLNRQFNRRVFLVTVFLVLASKKTTATAKINTLKCEWCWLGAVTNNSITIKAKLNDKLIDKKNYVRVFYHKTPNLNANNREINKVYATSFDDRIATFNLTDLAEDTVYYYVVVADGRRYPSEGTLQFKTVRIAEPYSFAIACSSCAGGTLGQFSSSGVSNSKVFDAIAKYRHRINGRDANLAMFIHMGDLHYRNDLPWLGLKENYLEDYRDNYDLVMTQNRQKNLYQNIPLAYIWDDHDYGFNDSDGTYNLKYLASEVYREQVPHYPLVEAINKTEGTGGIYQSFVIGRVRFIMTDSRFHRIPTYVNSDRQTLLGNRQRAWLFEQLKLGKKQQQINREKLTIWVNSIPWIAEADDNKTDAWNKYERERQEIANFIKYNNINNLLMISGDAHMLALDDGMLGTANNYATGGGGSFPIIQAASLDSRGSFKGGSYNGEKYIVAGVESKNGAIPGKGQWGLLNFIDNGKEIKVEVELKRMEDTLIEHTFIF